MKFYLKNKKEPHEIIDFLDAAYNENHPNASEWISYYLTKEISSEYSFSRDKLIEKLLSQEKFMQAPLFTHWIESFRLNAPNGPYILAKFLYEKPHIKKHPLYNLWINDAIDFIKKNYSGDDFFFNCLIDSPRFSELMSAYLSSPGEAYLGNALLLRLSDFPQLASDPHFADWIFTYINNGYGIRHLSHIFEDPRFVANPHFYQILQAAIAKGFDIADLIKYHGFNSLEQKTQRAYYRLRSKVLNVCNKLFLSPKH